MGGGGDNDGMIGRLRDGENFRGNVDRFLATGSAVSQAGVDRLNALLGPECCRGKVLITPQCVLNSYPRPIDWTNRKHNSAYRQGRMVLHFAGDRSEDKVSGMKQFVDPKTGLPKQAS